MITVNVDMIVCFQDFVENSNTKIETLKRKKTKVRQIADEGAEAWEIQQHATVTASWASHKLMMCVNQLFASVFALF